MARKILLADDSVTAQNMGRKILADAGYEVITVNNGSAALKKIAETKPDLIVLDVYMPGYSGLEVCQRLKEAGETARIPVLLTVGKLEPFKPEEARRVRAEGFIVKPFEASELLSALTKLEDKMVPRADSSKPGRFARAIAAVEEGRYDNTVAIDEDSGWKNRIAFPSKKKTKKTEPEDGDDPAIYNAVNKDLKTKVEHPAPHPQAAKAQEHVDLAALAPEGLPKDVTPEEIAALAAAAAQVKGIIESSGSEPTRQGTVPPISVETKIEAVAHNGATTEKAQSEKVKIASADHPGQSEAKVETTPDSQESGAKVTHSGGSIASTLEGATFATQKSPDEQLEQKPRIIQSEADTLNVAQAAGATQLPTSFTPNSSSHSPSQEAETRVEAEPVTMARTVAGNEHSSRWTAVATELAPEEIGIVLEEEMRKVYAAFVGAHPSVSESFGAISEVQRPVTEPAWNTAAVVPESPSEPLASASVIENSALPQSAEPDPTAAMPVAEPASSRVKEFETVQASSVIHSSSISAEPERNASASVEPSVPLIAEATAVTEAKSDEASAIEAMQPISEASAPPTEPTVSPVVDAEKNYEPQPVAPQLEAQPLQPEIVAAAAVPEPPIVAAEEIKALEPQLATQMVADAVAVTPVSVEVSEPVAPVEPGSGSPDKTKESEITTSTAAAWASWRRIRETGDSKSIPAPPAAPEKEVAEEPAPKEPAAMAVAAGAEKAPEEVPESSELSPEIANIVDSMLADLRPKIVEEISRKLGKKK